MWCEDSPHIYLLGYPGNGAGPSTALALGARAQELAVLQTEGPLRLTAGETLDLNCTLIGYGPPGGVGWYKGSDRSQPPVYYNTAALPPGVIRFFPGSETDYSIRISNIQPEDAGTYYCVKYKAGIQETEYKSGKGTEVSVSDFLLHQPHRHVYVQSGAVLTLECTITGLSPTGPVRWFKGDGANRKLIFPNYTPPNRVRKKDSDSDTDFTIFLHNVVPEDAGIYYCVKQRRLVKGDEDLQSGHGTEVLVDRE
ncbi:signal-regulatory protein beta-2-like [Heteronotia binoei]|uniref:signal-regulatory protein beta-2-like n=1 Tax=Heteronotia binoei TaxID=13085 RepID=UPI00292F19C8|nr:signal-regulatory protein beta-2-like [Heteronotia binoei]